jgi:hypothetical protein
VRRNLSFLLCIGFLASVCHADARWCSIVGRGPSDTIIYPPIARVARVQGVILSRIYYLPSGQVKDVEVISGPVMLSNWISEQLKSWTIKTDATGDEVCVTLVIADFRLHSQSESMPERPITPDSPSILRLSIDGEITPILYGGGVVSTLSNPLSRFKYAVKRKVSKIFAHRS